MISSGHRRTGRSGAQAAARLLWLGWLLLLLSGCSPGSETDFSPGMRGVWVQARSIRTPEDADSMLARAESGGLDAVFVNVLYHGHALWDSDLVEKLPSVEADYDPLAYTIEQAHARDIAVHAWLVAGPMSHRGEPAPTLAEHPEWAMVHSEGQTKYWLNYTRPDVRRFIGDMVMEIVRNYDVDGIHFDYTRYPGAAWSFDAESTERFSEEHGLDLNQLRYAELPAYAIFRGNPLIWAGTAQVLAEFDNGQPAVLLNNYGAGQVILLNWDPGERQVAVSSEILDRSIDYLLGEGGQVYVLRSETNATKYSPELFEDGIEWIEELGWHPVETTEAGLPALDPDGVVVLPWVYLIGAQGAADLADFVHQGGGVVFIDGPTRSMGDKNVRALTGMHLRGRHFKRAGLLTAVQEHDIIPTSSSRPLPLEEYRARDAQWKAFRARGINDLLQEVYQRVKQDAPDVLVSITVHANQDILSERHLLDWQTWIEGGYVDLIIPRAYVPEDERLAPVLADWRSAMAHSDRIAVGLITFNIRDADKAAKAPQRILDEIANAYSQGSQSIVLFDLRHTSDAMLRALASGPFSPSGTASE